MAKKRKGGRGPIRKAEYGGRAANVAGVVVLAAFFLLAMLSIFRIRIPFPSIPLPAQLDSTPARIIGAVAGALALLLVAAALAKAWEIRRARAWPSTAGRVVSSRRRIVETSSSGEGPGPEIEVAEVVFRYAVGGKAYESDRATMAHRVTGEDIEPLLARYPSGATVTVFYDPKDPADGVIERQAPEGVARGCLIALAFGVALTLFVMRLATEGPEFVTPAVRSVLPNANGPLTILLGLMAAGFLAAACGMARPVLQVRRWPSTSGSVLSTSVAARSSGGAGRHHRPVVRYRYAVGGRKYENSNVEHGMTTGGSEGWANRVIARYPPGSTVSVRYNPDDPSQSSLSTVFGAIGWAVLAIGGALLLAALAAAGLFG
jgi:hypothetical protein